MGGRPVPLGWFRLGSGSCSDCPRHEFIDAVDWMAVSNAGERVGEIGLGIEAVQFGGLQDCDDRRCPRAMAETG